MNSFLSLIGAGPFTNLRRRLNDQNTRILERDGLELSNIQINILRNLLLNTDGDALNKYDRPKPKFAPGRKKSPESLAFQISHEK